MSLQHDNTASTGGDEYSHSPTPRSRSNLMLTLTRSSTTENNVIDETTVGSLIADQVAIIFSFLKHNEIMHARVCTTWRDAAKKTLVPPSNFLVKDVRSYNALRAISSVLPNIQRLKIWICDLGDGYKYTDGEDPDEELAGHTANYTAHDITFISNFRMLRILILGARVNQAGLNGRYPVLFNFPMLQILKISCCPYLRWDLEMLSGCPLLRVLNLIYLQQNLTGNLKSLRVLKNTLEVVDIRHCRNIRGNFMELADFSRLRKLSFFYTPIRGDIRHIQEDDFPFLETLLLPSTVIGGLSYTFERISDVPSFMQAIHPLLKRFPKTFNQSFKWWLSRTSNDWYEYEEEASYSCPSPPFEIHPVRAGSRLGWRWCSPIFIDYDYIELQSCEVNWLDPEPSQDSDDYDKYVECLQKIEGEIDFYRGYYELPTEEEYRLLCLSLRERED